MCAGQHFLQQDIAFSQPLEQRDRVGPQYLAGFLHLGHRRNRDLTRLVDRRPRRLLQFLQRLADGAGGELARGGDRPRDVGAVVQHRVREALSSGLDRFQGIRGDAVDIDRELAGPGADRLDQRSALAVDHLRQPIGLLLDVADDFVGLAAHGRAERAAGGENRAFDLRRGRLDPGADFVRRGYQSALRIERAGLDIVRGIGGDRAERPLDVGGDRPDLAGGFR